MYKKILLFVILLTFLFSCFVFSAQAKTMFERLQEGLGKRGEVFVQAPAESVIVNVIMWMMSIIGIIAVAFIIYGAVMYITSGGSEEHITRAKKILLWAIVGLIIAILALVIAMTVTRVMQADWCLIVEVEILEGTWKFGIANITDRGQCETWSNLCANIPGVKGSYCAKGRCNTLRGVVVDLSAFPTVLKTAICAIPGSDILDLCK